MLKIFRHIVKPTYLYQVSGQLSAQLLGFLLGVVLVRVSGVEISGGYYSLLAIMNMTLAVVYGGILTNYLRNAIVKDYLVALITIIVSTFIIFLFLLPIFLNIGYKFSNLACIYIISLFTSFIQISIYSLRLRKLDKYVFFPNILPISLLIIALVLFQPKTLSSFLLLSLFSWGTSIFFVLKELKKISYDQVRVDKILKYLNASKILMFTSLMTQIYGNLDTILIKYSIGDTSVGLYKIATSITMFVLPSIGIFSFIYLSEIRNYLNNKDFIGFIERRKRQFQLILFITILFVFFSVFFNKYIIELLYDLNSMEVVITSVILSLSIMFNALSMVNSYTLIGMGQEKKILKVTFFAAIANIILNVIFIHIWDILGAAIANTFTQITIFIYYSFILKKEIGKLKNNLQLIQ
ncbi:MATE domain protein [Capnocytophaga sp. oral taxon 332 str. F0381]|jgi:polysaccharide biosynthesis related protein|uniref:MATE family efflux transporter n=1 Tax=Capnocytophaga sp. oral taxon 332 TaxID=712213 RepID=UPI0002A270F4|nr:polysaccharide biosynthesis C-terminal domain-containing protein [Capnocytophaga sp. oral taxon 332]EKY07636.1 MATE domain protein [Capnocytophaga sp. oral taxon 332 str. F0381]